MCRGSDNHAISYIYFRMKMEALLKAKIFRKCTQVLAQYLIITLVTLNLKEKDVIDQTQVFP